LFARSFSFLFPPLFLSVVMAAFMAAFMAVPLAADTLRLAYPRQPASLDPQRHPADPAAWPVVMTAYRRLFDLKPGTAELEATNSAAATYRVSDDGKIYTIILQEGRTFTDGAPVDSQAALFTFDRLMSTQTGRRYFPYLRYLEIIGPYTFRLHLDRPFGPFLASLTLPMASLISPGLGARGAGYLDRATLGSGRFEVDQFKNGLITMRIRADSPSVPKLDSVEYLYEPDAAARLEMVRTGRAHLAWDVGSVLEDPPPSASFDGAASTAFDQGRRTSSFYQAPPESTRAGGEEDALAEEIYSLAEAAGATTSPFLRARAVVRDGTRAPDERRTPAEARAENQTPPQTYQQPQPQGQRQQARPQSQATGEATRWTVLRVPSFETRYLAFNMTRPYMRMNGVREAAACLARVALASPWREGRPSTVFPAGLAPGAGKFQEFGFEQLEERARELLQQIGPSRMPLDLAYDADDPLGAGDAEKLAAKLGEFGMTARPVPLRGAHGRGILEKADWDLLLGFRRPEIPSGEMWLGLFLDSRVSVDGNPARFESEQADGLLAELEAAPDHEKNTVLRRLAILAAEQRPYVMLYQRVIAAAVDRRLETLAPHPMWPEVWPVDDTSLDPFRGGRPQPRPQAQETPLFQDFDDPVAEPYE
jgi:ABC-type transport system substrate-binding protein